MKIKKDWAIQHQQGPKEVKRIDEQGPPKKIPFQQPPKQGPPKPKPTPPSTPKPPSSPKTPTKK